MAAQKSIQKLIDRTPYRSCFFIAIIGFILFIIGAIVLINVGGEIKHFFFNAQVPEIQTDEAAKKLEEAKQKAQDTLEKAKTDTSNAIQSELEKQKADAAAAAAAAAKEEAQKQLDALTEGILR